MSKFLIDDYPLMVLPKLAVVIGLNEAIFLQQLHYWLSGSTFQADGHTWIYNTMKEWAKQFPFWSERTLARITASLANKGLILTGKYNRRHGDQTKWYTIDYDALAKLELWASDREQPSEHPQDSLVQDNQPAACGKAKVTTWQHEQERAIRTDPAPVHGKLPTCLHGDVQPDTGSLPACLYGPATLADPLPENNSREETAEITEETTTGDAAFSSTARTSILPMEQEKLPNRQRNLLLFATKIGLSEAKMQSCIEQYGLHVVCRAAELLRKNLRLKKPIQNPAGWLIKALQEGYQDTIAQYAAQSQAEQEARRVASERHQRRIKERYEELDRARLSKMRKDSQGTYAQLYGRHGKGGEAIRIES